MCCFHHFPKNTYQCLVRFELFSGYLANLLKTSWSRGEFEDENVSVHRYNKSLRFIALMALLQNALTCKLELLV